MMVFLLYTFFMPWLF